MKTPHAARDHQWSARQEDVPTHPWVGECSCGWTGESRLTCDDALRDGEQHATEANGWKAPAATHPTDRIAESRGYTAGIGGRDDCPYEAGSAMAVSWRRGYEQARKDGDK